MLAVFEAQALSSDRLRRYLLQSQRTKHVPILTNPFRADNRVVCFSRLYRFLIGLLLYSLSGSSITNAIANDI